MACKDSIEPGKIGAEIKGKARLLVQLSLCQGVSKACFGAALRHQHQPSASPSANRFLFLVAFLAFLASLHKALLSTPSFTSQVS